MKTKDAENELKLHYELIAILQSDVKELKVKTLDNEITEKEKYKRRIEKTALWISLAIALTGIWGTLKVQTSKNDNDSKLDKLKYESDLKLNLSKYKLDSSIEQQKLKSSLITKAFDSNDTVEVKKKLLFYIKNHLIADEDGSLAESANTPLELPSATRTTKPSPSPFANAKEMPVITVTNATTSPCAGGPIDGCWKIHDIARNGDAIAVQIYFRNTSTHVTQNTYLSILPSRTSKLNELLLIGGISNGSDQTIKGIATIQILNARFSTVTYMDSTARLYLHGQRINLNINPKELFSSTGYNIGKIAAKSQGTLVVNFRVYRSND